MTGNVSTGERLALIRESKPLIHNITNFVVMNETANAILALGALPVMAHASEEVEEMASVANALVLNIGTLWPDLVDSMILAGRAANRAGVPVVFDPVGAGATSLRTTSAQRILDEVDIALVRGNAAEVAVLAGAEAEIRGVESMGASSEAMAVARALAKQRNCVVAVTGVVDHVVGPDVAFAVRNGHPLLASITGSGCIATTMCASFAAVSNGDHTRAAAEALAVFGLAGERAAENASGPGTFHASLYDALAALTPSDVDTMTRIEEIPA